MTVTGINYNYNLPYNNPVSFQSNPTTNEAEETKGAKNVSVLDISEENERCTDGKDDGKIGIGSAIWNTVKGIGKTIGGAIKGMFTNKEGKFSLGKTLLSAGLIAASIICPAVGVAACAVGGAMGAIQIGKGIYGAVTAKTDAEAKVAWQNIGGGALTVGISAYGAKAGVKAMKTSSTAADGLASLEKGSSIKSYAKAFLKDAKSSTQNNTAALRAKIASGKEVIDLKIAKAKANKIDTKSGLTENELHILKNAEVKEAFMSDSAKAMDSKLSNIASKAKNAAKHPLETAKAVVSKTGEKVNKESVSSLFNKVKSNLSPKELTARVKNLPTSARNLYTVLTKEGELAAIHKYGYSEASIAQLAALLGGASITAGNM